MNTEYKYLIYLAACAVNSQIPDRQYIEQMDLCPVFRLAKFHTMTAVSFMALESAGVVSDAKWLQGQPEDVQSVLRKWKEAKEKAVRKNILLDAERAKFFAFCEKEQIWYMPLKGSVLKDIYPKAGMRQMADNDILFDASAQAKVRDYFVLQGYEVSSYAKGNHDVYEKKPIYNFEMHTSLFGRGHQSEMVEYYADVKGRLLSDQGTGCGYHFSIEDFYVYMLAHAYKHYDGGGTGLRTLMDIYVYRKRYVETVRSGPEQSRKGEGQDRYEKDWDRAYVEAELNKLGLLEYEQMAVSLAERMFGVPEGIFAGVFRDEDMEQMEQMEHYAMSGTYGTIQNSVNGKLRKLQNDKKAISVWTKVRYLRGRLFPSAAWFRENYAICDKFPIIIPFFSVYRLLVGSLRNIRNVCKEVRAVGRAEK